MNRQTLILLGGGLCAALLVALLMQAMLGGGEPQPATADAAPMTSVLVAARDLRIGDTLAEADMTWQEWPENALFPGAVTMSGTEDGEAPLSGRLKRAVAQGEPLVRSALVEEEKGNFVAATLGDGMRAMAIRVKAESSVGGFITPNDRVDVIMTYDVRLPADDRVRDASVSVINRKASQTVLENIRVVAVDQQAKEIEEVSVARTVTLEVTPKEGEILALSESMGTLSLALRKLGDDASRVTAEGKFPEATTDTRVSTVMQELLGNENSSGTQSRIVRIYNGSNPSDMVVRPFTAP